MWATLVALAMYLAEWEIFGAQSLAPRAQWERIAEEVSACTSRAVPYEAVQWHQADSIRFELDDDQYLYADGLHLALSPALHVIWLVDPDDSTVVRHELLHAAGYSHNTFGVWFDSLAKECR